MIKNTTLIFLLISITFHAQVGIGTTAPNAQLDITASNQATPAVTDGILIPRVDQFPFNAPTVATAQHSMLVYLTTTSGTKVPGFYYWDSTIPDWVALGGNGAKRINDLFDGKSDVDGTQDGSSVFLGINAGFTDDGSDNRNVGLGFESLKSTTTGQYNSAIGWGTLKMNTGNFNTAIGTKALNLNTSGGLNSAFGVNSLRSNTTGFSNIALGGNTMSLNTIGFQNVAVGLNALYGNIIGSDNVAIGYSALQNTTGNFNIGIGHLALWKNTNSNNIAIGAKSGYSNLNGANNIFLGNSAGYNETGSNTFYIENTNADANNALLFGNFGIDNTSTGNILRTNSEFQISNPALTGYAFPTSDGAAGQILVTNGSGQLIFANNAAAPTPHNTLDMAYDQGVNPGDGRVINADSGMVLVAGTDGLRTTGAINSGNYLGVASGDQMFYYPRRGAFRAGTPGVGGTWEDVSPGPGGGPGIGNIGNYSVAMGSGTTASGQFSVALVNGSSALAESTVAIGNGAQAVLQDDVAIGQGAVANGSSATAIGESTEALGKSSIAFGSAAHALGDTSTAIGNSSQAEALNSTAIGFGAQALGDESLAIGMGVRTDSFREFAIGSINTNGGGNKTAWVATDRLFSIGNSDPTIAVPVPSNALVILKNGNTGIGSDNPTSKLQVVGLPIVPFNTDDATTNADAKASGLTIGAFYHTGNGIVRVVF